MIDRRATLQTLFGMMALSSCPSWSLADAPIGAQADFVKALKTHPFLTGYSGAQAAAITSPVNITYGAVPPSLRGTLYRNGPAFHDLGSDRYHHWFDAPGMIQKFTFHDGHITHAGRLIATRRNQQEWAQKKIMFSAFGTAEPSLRSGGSADGQNVANISVIYHAEELLALWEGGSAHSLDDQSLETKGRKIWTEDLDGLPFGAHPRCDRDGSLWNIGYLTHPSALILYHISAEGQLLRRHVIPQKVTAMIHDFMVTDSKLLLLMPPFLATNEAAHHFADLFSWHADEPATLLVIDKQDFRILATMEMPPFWVFHFGNATDISADEIKFDYIHHDKPDFITKVGYDIIRGSWNGRPSAKTSYRQAHINLRDKTMTSEAIPDLQDVEFIKTNPHATLDNHRYVVMVGYHPEASIPGFNRLWLFDRYSGAARFYDAARTVMLEEHLIVPKSDNMEGFWIIGTSLDWQKSVTSVTIFDGPDISQGPVMIADLDIALPLGLHGHFVPH